MSIEKNTQYENKLSRLIIALEARGIKKWGRNKQVGEKTGYSPTQVSDIFSGKSNLTERFILSVCQNFRISGEWVKTGQGEILLKPEAVTEQHVAYGIDPLRTALEDELDKLSRAELAKLLHQLLEKGRAGED